MSTFAKKISIIPRLVLYTSLLSPTTRCLQQQQQQHLSSCSKMSSTPTPTDVVVGYITITNSTLAKELARKLVSSKLVACVNVVPSVVSIYEWKDKLEEDDESLMIIKAPAHRQDAIVDFVKKEHPYDVPEVIFAPIVGGNPAYLNWVTGGVESKEEKH